MVKILKVCACLAWLVTWRYDAVVGQYACPSASWEAYRNSPVRPLAGQEILVGFPAAKTDRGCSLLWTGTAMSRTFKSKDEALQFIKEAPGKGTHGETLRVGNEVLSSFTEEFTDFKLTEVKEPSPVKKKKR